MHSMNTGRIGIMWLLAALCMVVIVHQCAAEQSNKDIEEQQVISSSSSSPRLATKLLALPASAMSRFFFYHTRPTEHQATSGPTSGYKRSSSALDALTGVTLGKRSAPMELVNYEPLLGRQYAVRSSPRMYDVRWAPFDSLDAPTYNNNQPDTY